MTDDITTAPTDDITTAPTDDNTDICPICLEPLTEEREIRCLPCTGKHKFHAACLYDYVTKQIAQGRNPHCPCCRYETMSDAEVERAVRLEVINQQMHWRNQHLSDRKEEKKNINRAVEKAKREVAKREVEKAKRGAATKAPAQEEVKKLGKYQRYVSAYRGNKRKLTVLNQEMKNKFKANFEKLHSKHTKEYQKLLEKTRKEYEPAIKELGGRYSFNGDKKQLYYTQYRSTPYGEMRKDINKTTKQIKVLRRRIAQQYGFKPSVTPPQPPPPPHW
jgi:hypothetical protein